MRSDIESYRERAARLDLSGIDFRAFGRDPLSRAVLRCLRYMHDVALVERAVSRYGAVPGPAPGPLVAAA